MEHWIKWWYTSGTRTQKEHWVKNCPGLFNFLLFTFLYGWVVEYIPKWNNMNLFYVWVPIYGAFQFLSDWGFTIFWFAVFVPCHWFKPSKFSLFLLLSVSKLQQAFLYCTIGWWTKSQVLCFLSLGAPFRILSFTNWLQHVNSLVNHEIKQERQSVAAVNITIQISITMKNLNKIKQFFGILLHP